VQLTKIFLSSFLFWSCAQYKPVEVFVIDNKKQIAYVYSVKGVNKRTGEFQLEDRPIQSLGSAKFQNAVCTSYKDYNYLNYLWKRYFWNVSNN